MMRALALFLAMVLTLSALHKLRDGDRLRLATGRLAGVAGPLSTVLMVLAGAVEAVAALCLELPEAVPAGAAIAALLWLAYGFALWRRRGEVLDCGCDLQARPRAVDRAQIARPLVLAALAIAAAASPATLATLPLAFDAMAACGALALYFAALDIMAIPAPRWRTS